MISTCDLFDRFKDDIRYLDGIFQDFGGRDRFKGIAVTVKCFEDNSRIKELSTTPGEGKVLVVDGGGSTRCALLGDMIAGAFEENGWEGIIINGAVRDVRALAELDLGVRALGALPRASTRRGEGITEVVIDLPGARIAPGDVILSDEDGVVILTAEQAATLEADTKKKKKA